MRPSWNEYFMYIAKVVSTRSTCNSRPTGAVIVKDNRILATGYNGSIPGSAHCSDQGGNYCFRRESGFSDDEKFDFCRATHAEANAIVQASRLGVSVEGGTIYCTLQPCYTCIKLIVGAGIKRVCYELGYESKFNKRDEFWTDVVSDLVRRGCLEVVQIKLTDQMYSYFDSKVRGVTSWRRL